MYAAAAVVIGMFMAGALSTQETALSSELTGETVSRTVASGETLSAIGSRYGVDWQTLARDNDLDSADRVQAGRVLRIDRRHIVPPAPFETGILVNIPQRMLFYFVGGRLLHAYPIGAGRPDWPTPTGEFRVVGLDANPTWLVPLSIQEEMRRQGEPVVREVPPGPGNPLGAFRLRLDDPAYSIHGTDAPDSIYRFASHGCVRLHPDEIAALFAQVAVGTPVRIIYQPVLLAVLSDGEAFLEVHRDVYGIAPDADRTLDRLILEQGLDSLDAAGVRRAVEEAAGVARPVGRVPSETSEPGAERREEP